jgi:uncharacterized protein (TIGR02453 family)
MIQPSTLQFLADLRDNNNKPWFDAHKKRYAAAKGDVEQLVVRTLDILGGIDPNIQGLEAKQCMFRINRDVRFSANKSPYKTNMGFAMTKGGKKSPLGGYYVHLEPDQCFFGAGIYMPMPPELKKVRQEIAYCFEEFQSIVEAPAFQKFFGNGVAIEGHSLVKVPAGYDPDHRAAKYLKFKTYFAMHKFAEQDVTSAQFADTLAEGFRLVAPMVAFINRALEEVEA